MHPGETDSQRAAIWKMSLNGSGMALFAQHIRNAIALAVNPASGHLWAAGAGQDDLPTYHPYEFADDITAAATAGGGTASYGWPYCEENHMLYNTGSGAPANCNAQAQPLVEFPAYITHIGATFYPTNPNRRIRLSDAVPRRAHRHQPRFVAHTGGGMDARSHQKSTTFR